ncbi:TetR/AcrR family transcriptional regulator [Frigoribacterium sp. PhB24]|uniref:TetR/AcrR family transcriptional regulator n=1 Tax=Frigoribacterium sp. PhB24 TaxID=2485204 RepID=UPI000FBDCF73|nr:TetR family transcriptional regulator [Frigoribacterium sp. PhB24]ROS54689.1 TetR family transcriptional regulator [Frigoribacterium sp. PhB24]
MSDTTSGDDPAPEPGGSTLGPGGSTVGPGGQALTPKGETRRRALLDGVLAVLEAGGPSAVTHRAVARAAGVPVSAATYYFAGRDDLLRAALRHATIDWVRSFDRLERASLRDLAETLVRYAITERGSARAQYELLFTAMRDPSLREDAELWYSSLEHVLARAGVPGERLDVVALAVDGLIVRMLWRGEPCTVAATERMLHEIVGPLP